MWRAAPPPPPWGPEDKLSAMEKANQQRSLMWMNRLTARCFDECVSDMNLTRQMRTSEEKCVVACTRKFMEVSLLVGQRFVAETTGIDDNAKT